MHDAVHWDLSSMTFMELWSEATVLFVAKVLLYYYYYCCCFDACCRDVHVHECMFVIFCNAARDPSDLPGGGKKKRWRHPSYILFT